MAGVGAKFVVTEIDKGWNALRRTASTISERNSFVKVGVFDSSSPREGKMTNAKLAAIHEFGAPKAGIPERSFIRAAIVERQNEIVAFLRPLIVGIYEQKIEPVKVLDLLGLKVSTLIKRRVTSGQGVSPPNAPSTILRKLRKGKWNKTTLKKAADLYWKISLGFGLDHSGRKDKNKQANAESEAIGKEAQAGSGKIVKPLIDTGRLINSVTWIVVMVKGSGSAPEMESRADVFSADVGSGRKLRKP